MNNWTTKLKSISKEYTEEFGLLTKDQLNYKPSSKIWSIGQNIEHVIRVNESYYPVFEALKTGTNHRSFIARFGFIVTLLGKMILKSVQPETKKKVKTFSIWEPSKSQINETILLQFEKHQMELITQIEGLSDYVKRGTIICSPANRNIVYKLENAFDIIVAHEQRHLKQAKEVLNQLEEQS